MIDEINEREAPDGETALGLLQAVYRNKLTPLSVRMRAATIAIQYETPKLAVTGYVHDDASFAQALDRAVARANGAREIGREAKVLELSANPADADQGAGDVPPTRNGGEGEVPSVGVRRRF